ncbi:MAG: hypothetical protein RJB13_2159 [Pseudomonadota bacterium]|jgi:hypothetical protein
MKLAELCTAYPENCDAPVVRHPGDAIALAMRLKLRAQRGRLQSALDFHPQKTADRSGLGLRPYLAGDSLRALSARHLLLQDELHTRIDSSPGRFCVSVFVHCYENMEFRSSEALPNKMQTAWGIAGLLEQMHTQHSQKVNVFQLLGKDVSAALLEHKAHIQRSHFCYVVTDLLNMTSSKSAAVESLADALRFLNSRRGMVMVVRDPLESTDWNMSEDQNRLSFEPLKSRSFDNEASTSNEYHAGEQYLQNIKSQLNELRSSLQKYRWDSMWCTPEHSIDSLLQQLTLRLSGLRMTQ